MSKEFQFTSDGEDYRGVKKNGPPTHRLIVYYQDEDGNFQESTQNLGAWEIEPPENGMRGYTKEWFEYAVGALKDELGAKKIHDILVETITIKRKVHLQESDE